MATCTELDVYRQMLSNLARLSGFSFPAVVQSNAERDAWVSAARAQGVPESFIITAVVQPRNAWEEAAVNLIDVIVPSELIRIQGAFQSGGVCASGQSNTESGISILPASAFVIPPPPPLPPLESLGPSTPASVPPVAVTVSDVQGGTVQSDQASTAPLLGQVTTISPETRTAFSPGTIDGQDGPVSITGEQSGPVPQAIGGGMAGGAAVAAIGGGASVAVLVGVGVLLLILALAGRKKGS